MIWFFTSFTLLQGILVDVTVLIAVAEKPGSAYFITRENKELVGYAVEKFDSFSFFSCSYSCLQNSWCTSTNFKKYSEGNEEKGICELNKHNDTPIEDVDLIDQPGATFSMILKGKESASTVEEQGPSYVFTTLDAKEETGPRSTSGYVGTSLEGNVILYRGIQIWSVPATGSYVIEALGASGGDSPRQIQSDRQRRGGLGAKIRGTFQLKERTILKILVGQEGGNSSSAGASPGGDGGGSFVTLLDSTPLIIAGGGGGGGTARDQFTDGDPGQATGDGTQCGGREGAGGQICNADTGRIDLSLKSGGGAGLNGDGARGGTGILIAAQSFINGGAGGIGPSAKGGFGGGGYATVLGGGGGGYSGGGVLGTLTKGTAGGGGSCNNGTEQLNISAVNKGDGKVIIKFMN